MPEWLWTVILTLNAIAVVWCGYPYAKTNLLLLISGERTMWPASILLVSAFLIAVLTWLATYSAMATESVTSSESAQEGEEGAELGSSKIDEIASLRRQKSDLEQSLSKLTESRHLEEQIEKNALKFAMLYYASAARKCMELDQSMEWKARATAVSALESLIEIEVADDEKLHDWQCRYQSLKTVIERMSSIFGVGIKLKQIPPTWEMKQFGALNAEHNRDLNEIVYNIEDLQSQEE